MPSSIRPGCKVEARVGPKRVESIGDRIGIQSLTNVEKAFVVLYDAKLRDNCNVALRTAFNLMM